MLAEQIADFVGRNRFAEMVLGALALTDRVMGLVEATCADGGRSPDGPIADVFLGVISLRRNLRAVLTTGEVTARLDEPAPDGAGPDAPARWLR